MVRFPIEPVIRQYRQLIELSPLERAADGLAREIPLASSLGIEQRQFGRLRFCKEFQFPAVDASIKSPYRFLVFLHYNQDRPLAHMIDHRALLLKALIGV